MAKDQKLEKNNIILYKGDEGAATIEVLLKDDTMWSTQKTMAELFDVTAPTINEHLKNIFPKMTICFTRQRDRGSRVDMAAEAAARIFLKKDCCAYSLGNVKKLTFRSRDCTVPLLIPRSRFHA